MIYRQAGAREENETPRLPFFRKWQTTTTLLVMNASIAFVIEITPLWIACAVLTVAGFHLLERFVWAPSQQRSLERVHYLENLPRTPDGGAVVTKSEWEKHFPSDPP